jgi:hypothetical protein
MGGSHSLPGQSPHPARLTRAAGPPGSARPPPGRALCYHLCGDRGHGALYHKAQTTDVRAPTRVRALPCGVHDAFSKGHSGRALRGVARFSNLPNLPNPLQPALG